MAQFSIAVLPEDPYRRDSKIEVSRYPAPRFFFCADCDRFTCPDCGRTVERDGDDGCDTWNAWLEAAANAANALTHRVQVPCCKHEILLSLLGFSTRPFGSQAAMRRLKISLDDIDPDEIDDTFLLQMDQAMGCKAIRLIGRTT